MIKYKIVDYVITGFSPLSVNEEEDIKEINCENVVWSKLCTFVWKEIQDLIIFIKLG